jgi:glycosyltransferase involved in cell wall biosynthesis
MKNKFWYLWMRSLILMAYLYATFLAVINKFFGFKKRKKDVLIFSLTPKNSDGYLRRFVQFNDLFNEHGLKYDIFTVIDENEFHEISNSNDKSKVYRMYARIALKRAKQLHKTLEYKNIIVQRILFPHYPDYTSLYFEKLLKFLGGYRIVDIWDPIHLWNPKLTYKSMQYYDKVSVNTELLKDALATEFDVNRIVNWPIAVNPGKYNRKEKHSKGNSIRLFYTGSKGNTKAYLEPLIPVLESCAEKFDIELVVVGAYAPKSEKLKITHKIWSESTIKYEIEHADFGLYPNFQKDKTKNFTVAGKVLDYMSAGLPLIGADQGLPEGINIEKAIINVESLNDWNHKLPLIFENGETGQQQAQYALEYVSENLSIPLMFNVLTERILKN